MITLDLAKMRSLNSEMWAAVLYAWLARFILMLCVFSYSDNFLVRLGFVCALVIVGNMQWSIITLNQLKMDDLQLKLWMDELTWRTAFGEMLNSPRREWDDVIREATKSAVEDINLAKTTGDMFNSKTPFWVSMPIKFLFGIVTTLAEAAVVVLVVPHFLRAILSVSDSPFYQFWVQ